jgi:hypothetical protein
MHYFTEKKYQKRATTVFTGISAVTLAFVGVWTCYWGLRGSKLETVKELEYEGTVTMYSVLFLLFIWLCASFSIAVVRKPKQQWIIRTYTCILFFWAILFAGIAIKAPSEADNGAALIEENCANMSSPIHVVDTVYLASNVILCKSCICYANRTEFTYESAAIAKSSPNTVNLKAAAEDMSSTTLMTLQSDAKDFNRF